MKSLAQTHPELLDKWHTTKNLPLVPQQVSKGSHIRAWWICKEGHEWNTMIYGVSGCPECCRRENKKSLKRDYAEACTYWDLILNECDIDDLSINDGDRHKWICPRGHSWTNTIRSQVNRKNQCLECLMDTRTKRRKRLSDIKVPENFPLASLFPYWDDENREDFVTINIYSIVSWRCFKCDKSWQASQSQMIRSHINSLHVCNKIERRLFEEHTSLHLEWDSRKNHGVCKDIVSIGSHTKYWWLCKNNHSFYASANDRHKGSTCKYCANKEVLEGFNDLATIYPEYAKELLPELNNGLTANQVIFGSGLKIIWKCSSNKSHVWEAKVEKRGGCPFCNNDKVMPGYNDLQTINPKLAAEWHPTKNTDSHPSKVLSGTTRKFWWTCREGHEWKTKVVHRAMGTGCPICMPRGFNPGRPSLFYFIKHEALKSYKVGITDAEGYRLPKFNNLGWKTIKTYEHADGSLIQEIERIILNWIRKDLQMPAYLGKEEMISTSGWTETFSIDTLSEYEIIRKIDVEWIKIIGAKL